MSITVVNECKTCGIRGDGKYVGKCNFCDESICGNCSSWLPAKQITVFGTYYNVNRICKDCKPNM